MDNLTIEVGAVVQHFKRKAWAEKATSEEMTKEPYTYLYRIEGVAYNTNTGKVNVIYRALYGSHTLYSRDLQDFLYKVDESENDQGYRFVRYDGNTGFLNGAE